MMPKTFATSTRRLVIAAGQLPPPVHGFSYVTSRVFGYLGESGELKAYDLAARSGARGLEKLVSRLAATGYAAAGFLRYGRGARNLAYIACDGGHGLIYMLALTLAARMGGCETWLHHHSFAYIDRPRLLMRLINRCGGARLRHIVLSGAMQRGFEARYGPSHPPVIVSNAAFVPASAAPWAPPADRAVVVGCLSNLTREKGLHLFLALLDEAVARGVDIRGRLAGPIAAPEDRQTVEDAVRRLAPRLEYLGPMFGAERDRFYQSIDVFVLPTRYRNEAQPLVIFEAQAAGCLVMAYARGCIGDQLGDGDLALPSDDDFIGPAVERLEAVELGIDAVRQGRAARVADYVRRHEASKRGLEALFAGPPTPRPLAADAQPRNVEPHVRVDVWHNVLWARYKGHVFGSLHAQSRAHGLDLRFHQIAKAPDVHAELADIDLGDHAYPLDLLFDETFESIGFLRRFARVVRRSLRSDADLAVLAGYERFEYLVQALIYRLKGAQVLVCCDSTLNDRPQSRWKSPIKRLFFALCSGVLCYGERSRAYVLRYGVKPERIHVDCQAAAPLPAPDADRIRALRAELGRGPGGPTFLYVGRLAPEKDLETLLFAFAATREELGEARLRFVGLGPRAASLRGLASDLKVSDRVDFVGKLSGRALADAYLGACCLVLPSLSEPWGLVVNEALALGCPALVSDRCGCVPELIVPGRTGLVFRAGDFADLADKLIKAAATLRPSDAVTNACLAQIAPYTPARAARHILNGLLENSRRSPNAEAVCE